MPRDEASEVFHERRREEVLAGLRRKIEDGLTSLDRGNGLHGETVLAELERRIGNRDQPPRRS